MSIFKNISLGNDVIDFLDPDTIDLTLNPKFINRVYSKSEISKNFYYELSESRHLWRIWAAKEASYKAVKRLNPGTFFSPKLFELSNYNKEQNSAIINYQNYKINIGFIETGDYIHAAASMNIDSSDLKTCIFVENFDKIQNILDSNSLQESYSRESTFCRNWAVFNLKKFYNSDDIQIIKNPGQGNVPEIWIGGKRTSRLISLSHHGRYCGIFFSIP